MKQLFFLSIFLLIGVFSVNAQQVSYVCGTVNKTLTVTCTGCGGTTTYQWTSPSSVVTSGATVTANAPGVWTWQITSAGCAPVTGTHTITQETQPSVTINATDICINTAQTVSATGVPAGYTYAWNFGTGSTPATSTTATQSVTYASTGTKTITLNISKVLPAGECTGTCTWSYTKNITLGQVTGTSTCN